MSNHKPATPLPWETDHEEIYSSAWKPNPLVAGCAQDGKECVLDAAYIAHACNAYPELVEKVEQLRLHLAICVSALAGQDMTRPEILVSEARPVLHESGSFLAKLGEAA